MDGARGSGDRSAAEQEAEAAWLERLYALNSWANGLDIESDAFEIAHRNACITRWAAGRAAWNTWAEKMGDLKPAERNTLIGVTFHTIAAANFSELCFLREADFDFFVFPGDAHFNGAHFGNESGSLRVGASFRGVKFNSGATFSNVTFWEIAWFEGADFSDSASFAHAEFNGPGWFHDATFADSVFFNGAKFEASAVFEGVDFSSTKYGVNFEHASFAGPVTFNTVNFQLASFRAIKSERSFSLGAAFRATPDFREASFHEPPQLDEAAITPSLTRRHVEGDRRRPPLDWAKHAPDKYEHAKFRALRGMADQGNDHTSALRFNANEIAARRFWVDEPFGRNASRFWLGWLYQLVSDYGRSILRPLIGLFAVVATFAALFYAGAQPDDPKTPWTRACHESVDRAELKLQPTDKVTEAISLSIRNALIFDRSDTSRRTYGCLYGLVDNGRSGAIPTWVGKLSLLESLLSAIFLFLIGLALRNMFRLG